MGNSGFTHWKLWFSIVMLVYQRYINHLKIIWWYWDNCIIYLGKLLYFTNLNLAAIWGWFPLLTMIPGLGRSEVVIKFTQIYTFISLGVWRWPWNPRKFIEQLQSAGLLCPVRVFFAHCEHATYWYYLRLMAFLRLPKTGPKSPFEASLKDILSNLQCFELLTETSTNRKNLKDISRP